MRVRCILKICICYKRFTSFLSSIDSKAAMQQFFQFSYLHSKSNPLRPNDISNEHCITYANELKKNMTPRIRFINNYFTCDNNNLLQWLIFGVLYRVALLPSSATRDVSDSLVEFIIRSDVGRVKAVWNVGKRGGSRNRA